MFTGGKVHPTGSGAGWLGMPGDWSPPSRFIRTVMIVHSADPANNAAEAVNLAEHILNFDPGAEMKTIRIESGIRTTLDMTEKLRGGR